MVAPWLVRHSLPVPGLSRGQRCPVPLLGSARAPARWPRPSLEPLLPRLTPRGSQGRFQPKWPDCWSSKCHRPGTAGLRDQRRSIVPGEAKPEGGAWAQSRRLALPGTALPWFSARGCPAQAGSGLPRPQVPAWPWPLLAMCCLVGGHRPWGGPEVGSSGSGRVPAPAPPPPDPPPFPDPQSGLLCPSVHLSLPFLLLPFCFKPRMVGELVLQLLSSGKLSILVP